jgi:beta-phosphoglucomutase-like phosphatase (HAD superfamily)
MGATGALVKLSPRDYEAVLFDLDGVLTPTAKVHAAAWKRLFDDFLSRRAQQTGETFVAFDVVDDYRRYVDGRPRYDGAAAFLESRGSSYRLAVRMMMQGIAAFTHLLRGGTAERHQRYSTRHNGRGYTSWSDGQHGRPRSACVHGNREHRRRAAAQSPTAEGAGQARYAHPLSRSYA